MGTCIGTSLYVSLLLVILAEVELGHGQFAFPAFRAPQCSGGGENSRSRDIRSAKYQSEDMEASASNLTKSTAVTPPPKVFLPSLNVTLIGEFSQAENRTISVYYGIKYGVADRFKHSVLAGRYWGSATELNVQRLEDACAQISNGGSFIGSEDCLFLDVYVPKVDNATNASVELLPVMFFIHGGAFTMGEASYFDSAPIVAKDVIVVVIQYRLGTLGWLSLQNDDIPGNAGLSDMITALKWVQENIAAFGGDSNKVTIFGQSAGAASVSLLQTIGHVTKGLFSGVIAQSGSALENWAIDKKPIESAWMFATEFCKSPTAANLSDIYDCLSALPVRTISWCTQDMIAKLRQDGSAGINGCAPVVQGDNVSDKYRLITKMPEEYIIAGEALDVPLMMGANRDEGSFILSFVFYDYLLKNKLFNNANYFANNFLSDAMKSYEFPDSERAVREKYFPGIDMTSWEAITPGMIDFFGVSFVKAGTYKTAMLHSTFYNSSTFFYSFDYESKSTMLSLYFIKCPAKPPVRAGVTHGDELMYFFNFGFESNFTAHQRLTSNRMVTLWTNFAKYGNPTPIEEDNFSALGLPQWPKLEPMNHKYLLIQDDVTVAVNYPDRWTIRSYLKSFEDSSSSHTLLAANKFDIASMFPCNPKRAAVDVSASLYVAEPSTLINSTIAGIEQSHKTVESFSAGSMPVNKPASGVLQTKASPEATTENTVPAALDNAALGIDSVGVPAMEIVSIGIDTTARSAMEKAALGMETEAVSAIENAAIEMETAEGAAI